MTNVNKFKKCKEVIGVIGASLFNTALILSIQSCTIRFLVTWDALPM